MKYFEELLGEAGKPIGQEEKVDVVALVSGQLKMEPAAVIAGIKKGQFRINYKSVYLRQIFYKKGSKITFAGSSISVDRKENKNTSLFERFIELLIAELNPKFTDTISVDSRPVFCAYLINYFSFVPYDPDVILNSEFSKLVISELETYYKNCCRESKAPRLKELIEYFVKARAEKIRDLQSVTDGLIDGTYDGSLYKFLQEYNKVVTSDGFQDCVSPIISGSVYGKTAIENLIKPIQEARNMREMTDRFYHFEKVKDIYSNYAALLKEDNHLHKKFYIPIANHLQALLKDECDTKDVKLAEIFVSPTARKYNFRSDTRDVYDLLLNIKNTGDGLARNISIQAGNQNFLFEKQSVGILKAGEGREIKIPAQIGNAGSFVPDLQINYTWLDISGNVHNGESMVSFQLQKEGIPWEELERSKPYTIQEIEDIEKLYGRDQILNELKGNILSGKIESYKIWGQKRVGKSSIVKTLKSLLNPEEKIIVVWRSIASLKNVNPIKTLNSLGESLSSEIFEEIDRKIKDPAVRERLRSIEVPEFEGSLFPLEKYIKKLKSHDKELKFIFILDEFDRINEEFFLPGEIGDTLSLNIGKGLNENNYIGFILVGSENMHLLDRQGVNYNSYQEREVDTFDKESEFDSFKKIITEPVQPFINYSTDAIDRIYTVTAGNPYFANLICSHIFKIASKNRDGEIDKYTADKAIEIIAGSSQKSHFEHFWSDGITEETSIKKERKADIRRRLLISYSFVYSQTKDYPNRSSILKNFNRPAEYSIEQYEIENTLKEFFNRRIFYEDASQKTHIKPLLFEKWLCGPGRTHLIEGISDLEALQRQKQLEEEYSLKEEELKRIAENFPFKGEKLQETKIGTFFKQFGGPIEQRRVYKLLDSIYYISKDEINDFFKKEQKALFAENVLKLKLGARTLVREAIEIYSFPNTLAENIEIVESFKLFSHIRTAKTLKDIERNKDAWKHSNAEDIIIFETVINDFSDISVPLMEFFDERITKDKIPVKLCTLVITAKAKADLIKATATISNFKLIHFKEIEDNKVTPFIETTDIFETPEEAGYAFAEVRKHFKKVKKNSLNVVFEPVCPSKSIPILWCETANFKPLFPNPYGKMLVEDEFNEGEELRTRLFKANTELSQKLNKYIVEFLKEKAEASGSKEWLSVDLIPKAVLTELSKRHIDDNQKDKIETYFMFSDYRRIVETHKELMDVFKRPSEGIVWLDKLNNLRRDPAHPEKPAPSEQDVVYFETIRDEMILKMK